MLLRSLASYRAFLGALLCVVLCGLAGAQDNSQYGSQSGVPTSINAGSDFVARLIFNNSGSTTWTAAAGYSLKSANPLNNLTWKASTIGLAASTTPGENATFIHTFTAPSTPGTYAFQWSMAHSGVPFGSPSTNINIVVVPSANDAQFVTETRVPTSLGPGRAFAITLVMKNAGTATWNTTYKLVSRDQTLNTNWGTNTIPLVGTVSPGANATFNHTFTAPLTPGTYHFEWRMASATSAFGDETPNTTIVVSPDAATYVSESIVTSCYVHTVQSAIPL